MATEFKPLNTKAGMELFARVQMHNLSHHPTWDENMAYLKAIQRVEREAAHTVLLSVEEIEEDDSIGAQILQR